VREEDCFGGLSFEGALAMTALFFKEGDCFVREGFKGALAMTILERGSQ